MNEEDFALDVLQISVYSVLFVATLVLLCIMLVRMRQLVCISHRVTSCLVRQSGNRKLLLVLVFICLLRIWALAIDLVEFSFELSNYPIWSSLCSAPRRFSTDFRLRAIHGWFPGDFFLAAYSALIWTWGQFYFFLASNSLRATQQRTRCLAVAIIMCALLVWVSTVTPFNAS